MLAKFVNYLFPIDHGGSAREHRRANLACAEANRQNAAALLQAENDYWLSVLRDEPERRAEALDELDRLRVMARAS